jgi:Family of unknown function (DUF6510)
MRSHAYDYLDGSAAAGELSKIFAADITAAVGQCAHCGATKRFADSHLYVQCPGPRGVVRRLRARTPSSCKRRPTCAA